MAGSNKSYPERDVGQIVLILEYGISISDLYHIMPFRNEGEIFYMKPVSLRRFPLRFEMTFCLNPHSSIQNTQLPIHFTNYVPINRCL
jgi:hypothetical protein